MISKLFLIIILLLILFNKRNNIEKFSSNDDYGPEYYLIDNPSKNLIECIKFCNKKKNCIGFIYNRMNEKYKCMSTNNIKTIQYYLNKRNRKLFYNQVPAFDVYHNIGNNKYILNNTKILDFNKIIKLEQNDNDNNYYEIAPRYRPYEPTRCFRNSELWTFTKCKNSCMNNNDCNAVAKRIGHDIKSNCCITDPRVAKKLGDTGYFNTFYNL